MMRIVVFKSHLVDLKLSAQMKPRVCVKLDRRVTLAIRSSANAKDVAIGPQKSIECI